MARLLLLPGLASNEVMWQDQLKALPAHFSATVSDVHFRFGTVPAMAQALLAEHAGELILCGASMGGILAMEVARQAPARVKALALLGTNARPEAPEMARLRENAIELFEQGRARELLLANTLLAFHASRARDTALTQTYLDFVMAAGTQQLIRQNRAIMARPDARVHLPGLTCPTLVLCGDSDQLTPPECSREIATLIPHAELHFIAECGHMLTMERPAEVNARLLDWLARL